MSNCKLLCFGYYFPPSRAPEAIVSAKRTVGLKKWDVTFVSFELGNEDQVLARYVDKKFHSVVRLPLPLWARIIPRKILSRLPLLPDWLVLITKYASRKLQDLQLAQNDVFITCSQSHSSHLVGLEVKKTHPQLPWIAHFSDPWANNPYASGEQQGCEQELEEKVFHSANLLIFTSEETKEYVGRSYPEHIRSKMRVLPHAYDPDFLKSDNQLTSNQGDDGKDKIIVRHIGALYGKRSPVSFFDAVAELQQNAPELLMNVSFEFVGPIDAEFSKELKLRRFPEKLVNLRKPVSYLDSLTLMQSADALLVIDAPSKKSIFLPSKLIDYIGVGKPILALSPPGTTNTLICAYGGHCCEPDEVQGIVLELRSFLTSLGHKGNSNKIINEEVRSRYHVEKVGEKLQIYLNEVISESTD